MPTPDDDLEEEGQPDLAGPPPGQDLDLDQTAPSVPRDRPRASTAVGTTAAEARIGESVRERASQELPEFDDSDIDTRADSPLAGRLLEPDSDIDELDMTAEAVAFEGEDDDAGMSAEELAMHIVDEDETSDTSPDRERSDYLER